VSAGLTLRGLRAARSRIAARVHQTPLLHATTLGERVGVDLWLKCENLQKTGSFKARGALNAVLALSAAARERGVVTVSAGNHAAALAWSSRAAGVCCTTVMPATASRTKVEATASYGARVILHGSALDAFARAHEIADREGLTFVHPFDDESIVAGAASVGLEILEDMREPDAIVVPVGGGGLIAGVAAAIKLTSPRVRVYGVEPIGAAAMRLSLDVGHATRLESMSTIADGLAAPMAGKLPFELVNRFVDDVVTIGDGEIASAVAALLTRAKLLAEPAGAAATAAVLAGAIPLAPGGRIVAIVSGGNVDVDRLFAVLETAKTAAA